MNQSYQSNIKLLVKMKKMMKFLWLLTATLLISGFASCSDDDDNTPEPGPNPPVPEVSIYPTTPNTFVVNGEQTPVGTTFVNNYEGYVLISVSPTVTDDYNELVEGKFLQVMVLPQFLNKEINLKEQELTINASEGEEAFPITPSQLESGSCKIEYDETTNKYTLLMAMTMTDGTEVGINASAIMTDETPEEGSTITVNDKTDPIRAQFYLDNEGLVYLYFTSAGVVSFSEMQEAAMDYFYVVMSEDDLTGNPIDITKISNTFMAGYVNQVTGANLSVMTGELDGATGTVSVSRDATDNTKFTADIDVAFGDGTHVVVAFDGNCMSVNDVPEEPNEMTVNGATEQIQSALVDKTDPEIWHIYLSSVGGLEDEGEFIDMGAFHITAPAEVFNAGYGAGFSTYKDVLKFEYEGNTWQYVDADTKGSLTVDLTDDGQLTVDFTTYGDVKGHYSGPAVVIGE